MPRDEKPKVLFILKLRQTSGGDGDTVLKSAGLYNSALFVKDMLVSLGYETNLVQVVDNNGIDREVSIYKPDIVIIEALWVVPEKFDVLKKLHPKVKWIIRLHSEIPFLSNEGIAMSWINEYIKQENVYVSANSMETYKDLDRYFSKQKLSKKILYLPNYYPVDDDVSIKQPWKKEKKVINIGCFGAIRPMKNHLIQAVAAMQFASENGVKLRFHINGSRVEQKGESVLRNLRALFDATNGDHELVEHGWMSHQEFLKLIETMDIGLQVSFSESFNIVSADFVNQNIPMVTSREVDWIPMLFTASPTSTNSIISAIERALFWHKFLPMFNWQKLELKKYSRKSIAEWVFVLRKLN